MREYQKITAAIAKNCAQANAVYNDYKAFARINQLDLQEAGTIARFCAALLSAGLDPGTISTRIDYIRSERKREMSGGVTWWLLKRHYDLLKAKKGRRPKTDASGKKLLEELAKSPRCLERTICTFILLSGSRNGCIGGIGEILFSTRIFACDVLVSKQRRSAGDFGTLRLLRPFNIWADIPSQLQIDLNKWALQQDQEGKRKQVSTSQLLQWMQKHINKKYTTYTFRRAYIHRVIDGCTSSNGTIDYQRVISMTMHFQESTIRAFYEKRTADLRQQASTDEEESEQDE